MNQVFFSFSFYFFFFFLLIPHSIGRCLAPLAPHSRTVGEATDRLCLDPRCEVSGADMIAGAVGAVQSAAVSVGVEVGQLFLPLEWYSDDSVGS